MGSSWVGQVGEVTKPTPILKAGDPLPLATMDFSGAIFVKLPVVQ